MKIAVITCDNPCQRYFVNKINDAYGVDALFLLKQQKRNARDYFYRYYQGFKKHWQKGDKTISGTIEAHKNAKERNSLINQLYPDHSSRVSLENKILSDGYKQIDIEGRVYTEYRNVNSSHFKSRMKQESPNVLLVFGGPIVCNEMIAEADLAALNLHWGLSPYYRGGRTTIWPIYNDEPEYIGVTIHRLSHKIDGGEIVTQAQPVLTDDDNLYSIELKLSKLGTSLVLDTLSYLKEHSAIPTTIQDFSKGRLYLSKHLTPAVLNNVKDKLKKSYFKSNLPSDKAVKSIDLIQNV